jgi:tRNA(Ile)-lysidine synthase TilS/MesJ
MHHKVLMKSQILTLSLICFDWKVLACSGGSDSISLYLLLERWIKKQPLSCIPWNLIVCTVDHKLRPESATEAAQVHSWMKSRGNFFHMII